MAEENRLFNRLIEIARRCAEAPEQAGAIEGNFRPEIESLLGSHGKRVDQRESDAKTGIFKGFSALHYAAYHGFTGLFEAIFPLEWDLNTGAPVEIDSGGRLIPLGQNSSALMIALLRRHSGIVQFYDRKITSDSVFRTAFLPFQNRQMATNIQVAALMGDFKAGLDLLSNKHLIEAELPVNSATEGFFFTVCTFGQLAPLTTVIDLLEGASKQSQADQSEQKQNQPPDTMGKGLLYKTVLSYTGRPNLLEQCERSVPWALFGTSPIQKHQVKARMARLLQDALDYCVNRDEFDWKALQHEWRKSTVYFYEEDDVEKVRGRRIGLRDYDQTQARQALSEPTDEQWFSGAIVREEKIQFAGKRDQRDGPGVHQGFTLSFYALLREQIDVLSQICAEEADLRLERTVTIESKAGQIVLEQNFNLLQAALELNSVAGVEYLARLGRPWDGEASNGEDALTQALRLKNQASIALLKTPFVRQKIRESESVCLSVLQAALKYENIQALELFVEEANGTSENYKASVFSAVFKAEPGVAKSADCRRLFKLLEWKASAYIREKELFKDPRWESVLQDYYGADYQKIVDEHEEEARKEFAKKAQRAELKFSLAAPPQVADYNFDQNRQRQEIEYEDEVVSFENDLFRDPNPFDQQFFAPKSEELEEKITLMNLVLDDFDEQREAMAQVARDDIIAKPPQRTLDWFNACAQGIVSTAQAMHRTCVHSVEIRPSQLSPFPGQSVYNGMCGLHYAVINGHYEIVQMLFDYEFLDVTKARVFIKAAGIGQNKLVIVPIGTNCLQLAALSGQKEILALLVDEVVRRNSARLVDPIQASFGKKPPLDVQKKLQIFQMKNELQQGILHTLATCRAFFDEESVAAICLELQDKKESPSGAGGAGGATGRKSSLSAAQTGRKSSLASTSASTQVQPVEKDACARILEQRIDLAFRLGALFTNARFIRLCRQELLSDPLLRFSEQDYCQMMFQVASALLEVQGKEYVDLYQRDAQDTRREVDSTLLLIAARLYLKQEENSQLWEATFEPLQRNDVFMERLEQAKGNVNFLRAPGYQSDIAGQFLRIDREFLNMNNYYLDNVIQSPEASCYFDAVIQGDAEFVRLCYKAFVGRLDKRQTRGKIVNGFTGLCYACFYGHFELIKLLLQEEYDASLRAEPQQVLVTQAQSDYQFVFQNRCNFLQAAVLSRDQELVDQLLRLVREQPLLRKAVFPAGERTDVMKLCIYNGCGCIFRYADLIRAELEAESRNLRENAQAESILYMICKEQDPWSVLQVRDLLVQMKEEKILDAFYTSALQRLPDPQTGLEMTPLDWLQSTCMVQLNKQKLVPTYQQAIQFVDQLTNSGLVRAFRQKDTQMLAQYYQTPELLQEMQHYYEEHEKEFAPDAWLERKEEALKANYVVRLSQILGQDYQQYSNEELLARWFAACAYAPSADVQKLLGKCKGAVDSRMNNYTEGIYTGFNGLMYAIVNDNIQAFELLLHEEYAYALPQEQVLFHGNKYWYLQPGFSVLHLAALAGNQQFFDMLVRLYESKSVPLDCEQTPSSLAIISNKSVAEGRLLADFRVDSGLFRRAVQFGRVKTIQKLLQFGKQKENKQLFYANVFAKAPSEGEDTTVLDIVGSLEASSEDQITMQQVTQTKNLVRQTIGLCLTEMVVQNTLEQYSQLLEKFYDTQGIVADIRKEYEFYTNPHCLKQRQAAADTFCKVQPDQLTETPTQFAFHEHTSQEIAWFTACRANDIQFVRQNVKNFSQLTDRRHTHLENKVHRGFTGLMYAVAYGALEVVQALVEIEYEVLTQQDTVVQIEQQLYFVPKHSSVLHVALYTANDVLMSRILQKIRPSSPVYVESNTLQFTPIVLMAGLGLCYAPLVTQYLCRQNKYETLLVLSNSVRVDNYALVRMLISEGARNEQLKELLYEYVFEISQRAPASPNQAEALLLKQQEQAISYALQAKTPVFDACLRNMFGTDVEKVRGEYQEAQKYSRGALVTVSEEDLFRRFNVLQYEEVVPTPRLECLPKSQLYQEQLEWFRACHTGDVQYVKQNLSKYAGLLDDRRSLEEECFEKFSGLMYAALGGQFEVFCILLPYELHIVLQRPCVIKLSQQRWYLLEAGSTVANIVAVTGQQRLYTFLLQQKDSKLYGQLYQVLCTNKCYIQAVIGGICFNEDLFVTYLRTNSSENIIAQLHELESAVQIEKINALVEVCGDGDPLTQAIFRLALTAVDYGVRLELEGYAKLLNRAIGYAISQHNARVWKNLLRKNMSEAEIERRILTFKQDLQRCDVVSAGSYEKILLNGGVIEDPRDIVPEQELPRDELFQDEYVDEWFNAARTGDLQFIERSLNDCQCAADKRRPSRELGIIQGWTALHYAAYFGQLDVVRYLFQVEQKETTKLDAVLEAQGVGYGVEYLCPRGSNALQLAILADNLDVVQYLLSQIEVSGPLQTFFMAPNNSRQSALFTAAVAWRSRSGQTFLNSKLFLLEIGQISRKFDSYNAIQIIRFVNCAYLARQVLKALEKDGAIRAVIYQMVLETDQFVDGSLGSDAEKEYVEAYYNFILRDAMNHCIRQKITVQWSGIFDVYCQRHGIHGPALLLQFAKTETCTTEERKIYIPEEYIEITLKKLKPVATQLGGQSSLGVLPKKADARRAIEEDWAQLDGFFSEILKGKQEACNTLRLSGSFGLVQSPQPGSKRDALSAFDTSLGGTVNQAWNK